MSAVALRQELDGETVIESQSKGAYLRLDPEGFTAHPQHGKDKVHSWDEVSGFKPANVKAGTPDYLGGSPLYQIGFFLLEPPRKGRVSRWIVRKTYGVDGTLPGVYPNAEEVVALMERWRQRYGVS